MKNKAIGLTALILTTACSSTSREEMARKAIEDNIKEDVIISSSDGSKEYPEWAYNKPRFIQDGVLYVSGSVDINSSQSPARCLDAAVIIATSNLSREIVTRSQDQLQYASEGMGANSQSYERIINQESSIDKLHDINTSKRWFAKVKSSSETGVSVRYQCFALVGLDVESYKQQIVRAMNNTTNSVSESFKNKVNASWDKFLGKNDNETHQSADANVSDTLAKGVN